MTATKKIQLTDQHIDPRSKYDPELIKLIMPIMSEGGGLAEILAAMGISKPTHYIWMDKYPDYRDEVEKGVVASESWWVNYLRQNLGNKSANVGLIVFSMRNMFGWLTKDAEAPQVIISAEASDDLDLAAAKKAAMKIIKEHAKKD